MVIALVLVADAAAAGFHDWTLALLAVFSTPSSAAIAALLTAFALLATRLIAMGMRQSSCAAPVIEHCGSEYNHSIVDRCPALKEKYCPPALWGWNTHVHLILFGALGHDHDLEARGIQGELVTVLAEDGATISYDVFQLAGGEYDDGSPWVLVAPGFCNHSGSDYVQTFIEYTLLQYPGWRIAVLNHLGTDKRVPLTSPRLFSYGCTEGYDLMVQHIRHQWPVAPLVSLGFSMGGNIVLKYFGEEPSRQQWFQCVLSCCQGYDIRHCIEKCLESRVLRFYSFVVTRRFLPVLSRHRRAIFGHWSADENGQSAGIEEEPVEDTTSALLAANDDESPPAQRSAVHCCNDSSTKCHAKAVCNFETASSPIDADRIFACKQILDVDELYLRRVSRFANRHDFYKAMSSAYYMKNITDLPVFLFNADDDPIAPAFCYEHARKILDVNPRSMFVHTRHGSHMAFYNGGWLFPKKHNVFDQIVTQYIDAVLKTGEMKTTGTAVARPTSGIGDD